LNFYLFKNNIFFQLTHQLSNIPFFLNSNLKPTIRSLSQR